MKRGLQASMIAVLLFLLAPVLFSCSSKANESGEEGKNAKTETVMEETAIGTEDQNRIGRGTLSDVLPGGKNSETTGQSQAATTKEQITTSPAEQTDPTSASSPTAETSDTPTAPTQSKQPTNPTEAETPTTEEPKTETPTPPTLTDASSDTATPHETQTPVLCDAVTQASFSSSYGDEEYLLNIKAKSGRFSYAQQDGVLKLYATEESVLTFTGAYVGGVRIAADEEVNVEIDLASCTLISDKAAPALCFDSAKNADISATKDTVNFIIDKREAVDELSSAVYAECDLKLKGKGSLDVCSDNNNGIHSKDDLTVKNLTLNVECVDNALKGNDSVTIESGALTLIARGGDGIKASNTALSSTGKQKGSVTLSGGSVTIYAACDGIDAAWDVRIENEPALTIYTDKYSPYSETVTTVAQGKIYIRASSTAYSYSILYSKESGESVWVNSSSYESEGGGPNRYYYYPMDKPAGYEKMAVYIYTADQPRGQADKYYVASGAATINNDYDTIYYSARDDKFRLTNRTNVGGHGPGGGGMQDGNRDKGGYSTKGVKAGNEIAISGGNIIIEAYDDALHANSENASESGSAALGNITVSGGKLTLSSRDDGAHADGTLSVSGGSVTVKTGYEGFEGAFVKILGGDVSIGSSDDGINATATIGEGVVIADGTLYVYAKGDGIDSNSRSSYDGILISGGRSVIISDSNANSGIDSEGGYKYTGGVVIVISKSGGMSRESTNCRAFSTVGKSATIRLLANAYLIVNGTVSVQIPSSISAFVVTLGAPSAAITSSSSFNGTPDENGVSWTV